LQRKVLSKHKTLAAHQYAAAHSLGNTGLGELSEFFQIWIKIESFGFILTIPIKFEQIRTTSFKFGQN